LSQGELQRASLIRAVINRPSVILADEPTSALDDQNAEKVVNLLKTFSVQNGAALIIVTHDRRIKEAIGKTIILEA
jgi:putative ABC transport system ATP-binding protein